MGFWISLEKNGTIVEVDNHTEGGTVVLGGTPQADMSITYNYSKFWEQALGERPDGEFKELYGLGAWLHGKSAKETLELLQEGCKKLIGEPSQDYWEAIPGNARRVLETLLKWGEQHPDATWNIHSG